MFGYLRSLFSSNETEINNVLGGADEVFNAILEHTDGSARYVVQLGEPELVDRGGRFASDFTVRIPTSTATGEPEPPNVEYDLPKGEDENADLFDLLDLYNIDQISDLADLQGESVIATFEDGTLSLRFDLLREE